MRKPAKAPLRLLPCLLLLIWGAIGCQRLPPWQVDDKADAPLYLPPSPAIATFFPPEPAASATAAPNPVVTALAPSPTPLCADNLRYLSDLTVPDGSTVAPGSRVDKRWLVENNGTCNWDTRYRLKFIAGSDLGVPLEQALFPARSGTQLAIRIVFTAPTEPGPYRSAWQAFSPAGESFGDPIFVDIVVQPTED